MWKTPTKTILLIFRPKISVFLLMPLNIYYLFILFIYLFILHIYTMQDLRIP